MKRKFFCTLFASLQVLLSIATETSAPVAQLPTTDVELGAEIRRLDSSLERARHRLINAKSRSVITAAATDEEIKEQEAFLRQIVISLDQEGRHLRSLRDVRRVNLEQAEQHQNWRRSATPANGAATEQLIDSITAARLEHRTAQMLLSILEGEIAAHAGRLHQTGRQLRLAMDVIEQSGVLDLRRQWTTQLAQLRNDASEAAIEAAQVGRLVTLEALEGRRAHLDFLERELAGIRAQTKISKSDLDIILVQLNTKRVALEKELDAAIANEEPLRSCATSTNDLTKARVETNRQRIELIRSFLQLADYAETVWRDRFWAVEARPLVQLRARRKHHEERLQNLRQWKNFIEQSLAAISEQSLRQALRSDNSTLTTAERDEAAGLTSTFQDRTAILVRALGALAFTEDLIARLHADFSEQEARISFRGRIAWAGELGGALVSRIWKTELYVAEDTAIANGKKISIPRSITVGKATIALLVFGIGLLAARLGYHCVKRFRLGWFLSETGDAELTARAVAALIAFISVMFAMASVRIPWTIFAFMGGALAIGIGFGAQTLINNFISGIILLCEKSIRVGDIVEVDEQRGKIVRVGFRNSLVARSDGIEALIPNSRFLEKKVVNWTLSNNIVRYEVSVRATYGSSPNKVLNLLKEAVSEQPNILTTPEPNVLLDDFGENGLVFNIQFWIRLSSKIDGGKVRSELRNRIYTRFDEAGIEIPLTSSTSNLSRRLN